MRRLRRASRKETFRQHAWCQNAAAFHATLFFTLMCQRTAASPEPASRGIHDMEQEDEFFFTRIAAKVTRKDRGAAQQGRISRPGMSLVTYTFAQDAIRTCLTHAVTSYQFGSRHGLSGQ
eukprot:2669892-Rhodomonas_salina.2